ncbi:MAG TPA: DUF4215 domain-containing protein [Kofleriaceae bacterium]|nr:DUF4215 domain-containing protein [Kofleriaceae bacterium]
MNGTPGRTTKSACDDGNNISGDGCSANCKSLEICGNGLIDPGEVCDDGNNISGDGCSADCKSLEFCGNGIVDTAAGEQCDARGPSITCNANCTLSRCGDGILNVLAGEVCDDGNTIDGDGCEASCTLTP